MNKKLIMLSLATAGILFTGCGGGSSSSTPIKTQSISGNVIDPAVEGAIVSLKCKNNTHTTNVRTDAQGKFTIDKIPANEDLSSCTVLASGGNDGDDLTGLTLKAPYSLFNKKNGIYVTPFTTTVAEHDDFDTNPDNAKLEVANFLGADVKIEDLIKDPTTNIKLAKVTKKMTKMALSRKNGSLVGYIDIDDSNLNANDLNTYSTNLKNSLSGEEKAKLEVQLDAIDELNDSSNIDDLKKQTIIGNIRHQLNLIYKKTTYSDKEKVNLRYLAKKIAEANKQGTKYKTVTKQHLRKALTDVALLPSFKSNAQGELTNELDDSLASNLNLDANAFKALIDSKKIEISDINGIVLFDSSSYEQILGDDQVKRRNYYTYSDKSNIAKAMHLAKDSFTNDVNDPIVTQVANGLAKLGFYNDALEQIKDNVYASSGKQDAYKNLGKTFLELKRNDEAAIAFTNEYNLLLKLLAGNTEGELSTTQRNTLSSIIRNLTQTAHFEDNNNLEIKGVNTVINKVSSYKDYYSNLDRYKSEKYPSKSAVADYQTITNLIDDLATDLITFENDLANAKKIYPTNITLAEDFPIDTSKFNAHIFHIAIVAIHGKIFGLDTSKVAEKIFGTSESPITLSSANKQYKVIYDALNTNNIDSTITALNSLSKSYIDDAINKGVGAALFLNNKKDDLFNKYYTDTYYSLKSKDTLMQYNTQLKPSSFIPTSMAIRIKGGDTELKDYLDRLRTLASTWYVISDVDSDKANNITEGEAKKVYAQWSTKYNSRYGYLAIASMYKNIGEEQSAKDTINEAITKISAFPDSASEKADALLNIWNAVKELGYESAINVTNILTVLEASAKTSDDIQDIIEIANILTANNKKAEALELVKKAKGLIQAKVDSESDPVEKIKIKVESLIGNYNNSKNFESSIANGYLQLGTKNVQEGLVAKDIIKEAYDAIKTLGSDGSSIDTGVQYIELIHVISAYGKLNDLESLKPILNQIKTVAQNKIAKVEAAKALATYDAFSKSDIASIDSDEDGKPDFFDITASQEQINASNLELDKDIDNDTILDTDDKLPYDKI